MRKIAQVLVAVSLTPFFVVGALVHHIHLGYTAGHLWANRNVTDLMED